MVAGRVSRRALLGAAAATASGALALGCERSEPELKYFGAQETPENADRFVLIGLADALRAAIAAYESVPASRPGGPAAGALARRLASTSRAQLDALEASIHPLSLPSQGAAAARPPGRGLAVAALAQDRAIALLVDSLPKISGPDRRATAAGILAVAAEQAALLARARGLPPAPSAFVRGRS